MNLSAALPRPEASATLSFCGGRVRVDRVARSVFDAGQRLPLGGRCMDLLLALLDRRDRLVPRDELIAAVWPGRVVEANNLEVHVASLRRLLGAAAIVTVRGRGYRLVLAPDAALADAAGADSLLGRDALLAQALAMLAASSRSSLSNPSSPRTLTLHGPGGVGKTRLAGALLDTAAPEFAGGVARVWLASLRAVDAVPDAAAQALGLRPVGPRPLAALLLDHLQSLAPAQRLLLLLDNAEHLVADPRLVALLEAWRGAAPGLVLLVTSRRAVGLAGEVVLEVPPLAVPAPGIGLELALRAPAVQLFLRRARALGQDPAEDPAQSAAAVEVCRRLEGLPLALELAAARLPVLPPSAMLARLEQALPLLAAAPPPAMAAPGPSPGAAHQRSLRDTLVWSWDLLPPAAQVLMRRLAVFEGGCGVDGAVQVAGGGDLSATLDGLAVLLDASLLRREDGDGEPRYRMLETVREFALERLQAEDDAEAARQSQAAHLLELVESVEPQWCSPQRAQALRRLAPEAANLRAALHHAIERRRDAHTALRLVAALSWWWYFSARLQEGRSWQRAALALPGACDDAGRQARAELGAARVALYLSDMEAAAAHGQRAIALARESGDRATLAWALFQHAVPVQARSVDAAVAGLSEARGLFAALDDDWGVALATSYLGIPFALRPGEEALAERYLVDGRDRFAALGDSWGTVVADQYLGIVALRQGRLDTAREHARSALRLSREMGDGFRIASGLQQWARVEAAAGRWDPALEMLHESALLHLQQGRSGLVGTLLAQAGRVLAAQGDDALAVSLYAAAAVPRGPVLPLPADAAADAAAAALQALRERLAAADFEQGWARGQGWSLAQAVDAMATR